MPSAPEPSGPDAKMWQSELIASDAIGRIMEFWGFRRNMGRIWTVLYLSERPLTAHDLRARLQLSSGAVSMTLKELSHWGTVRKVWIQGERRDHFTAEGDLWKMVSRVFRERELVEVKEVVESLERALEQLDLRPATDEPNERARSDVQRARIKQLLELSRLGRRLVEGLVSEARVDARALARVLLGRETRD